MSKTKAEILAIAQEVAEKENWPWLEPIIIKRDWIKGIFGKIQFKIWSNANCKGGNICMLIDGTKGKILKKSCTPK